MQRKVLKTIAALTLAFTVAVPVTVKAANIEVDFGHGEGGCDWRYVSSYTVYEEANSEYHYANHYDVYKCSYCGELCEEEAGEAYETHNLSGYTGSSWYCVDCGYVD